MIRLIVTDAGHTLGLFTEPSTVDVLKTLSPLPEEEIAEEHRRFLHCEPELTEEVITALCGALLIDRQHWPTPWSCGDFTTYSYTRETLAELTEIAPIAVLSNLPVTCGPHRMSQLIEQCQPYIHYVYTSYDMRMRKPDWRLWQHIADQHHVHPSEIVHIGDQWINDVLGALSAGCRAIYVNTRDSDPNPTQHWLTAKDRVAITHNLQGTLPIIRNWHK